MSALISFRKDVKCLFSKYVADMNKINVTSSTGTALLQLGNYDSVKRFYYQIQVSIHGYDFRGKSVPPEEHQLPDKDNPGQFIKSAPHPMPPPPTIGGVPFDVNRLPQEGIDVYDQWVKDGLLP